MIGWELEGWQTSFDDSYSGRSAKLTRVDGKQDYLSKYPGEPKNRHLQRQATVDSRNAYEPAINIYLFRKEHHTFRPDAL
jgi:hypothetical protein